MGAACGTANHNNRSGRRQFRARDRINERRMRQHLQDDSSASENEESEPTTTTMESSSNITSPKDCVVTWHGEQGAPPGLSSPISPPTSPKPGQKEDPLTALRDDQRARLERVLRGTSAGAQGPNGGRPKIPPRRPSLVRRPSLQPHLARPGALNSPLQTPLSNNFLGTDAQGSNAGGDQDNHNMLFVENASFGCASMLPTPKNLSTTGSFAGGGPPIFASVPESGNTPDQKALNNNADEEGVETVTPLGTAISTARGGEGPDDERPLAFSPIEDQHSGNTARGEAQ